MSALTVDSLTAALHDLLNNEKYEINARRLSSMLEKKPVKSEQLVVKWTEFVAEFKQLPELESYARQLNFVQLTSLDIVVPFTLVLAAALFLVYKVFRALIRLLFGGSKLKNE
uniref:glucuronosyltransferase n=1 Tax=Plectus sambesii TaxID=2011161 RepID=A0A914XDJ3_9BILA